MRINRFGWIENDKFQGVSKHWYISTNASRDDALAAFSHVFFTRPQLKERFKLSKRAQLRSQQTWGRASAPDADIAAILESGGLREAIADSRRGPGSALGSIISMAFQNGSPTNEVQLWLAVTNTFVGFSQNNDVLKAYTKLVVDQLAERGFSATASKQ